MRNSAMLNGVRTPSWWRSVAVAIVVVLLLAGLPLAVYLDLKDLSARALRRQASDINAIISSIRTFYASDVVGRVLDSPGTTQVLPNYRSVPGAIPIPATLSIELGRIVSEEQSSIGYRFVSDYPFLNRAPHTLDQFERDAITQLRADPGSQVIAFSTGRTREHVRMATSVIMGQACVSCHNTHPDSPKRDWRVGDVRGIQEVAVAMPIATDLWSLRYLLVYFALAATAGLSFILLERRQAAAIRGINAELSGANAFLADISAKISHYLSPQVYRSIFSGEMDTTIHTKRKKLTIFFSDIKDFTPATERLQPEDLTAVLNEYLTEMSRIALAHGGTIDKFIGDAILVFFGDPETKGSAEDAKACVRMAIAMQRRLRELGDTWRDRGLQRPFGVRMGINTGYCNVGNFGSAERMDYTIIGAEANLAARLQHMAEPGSIVMSYEAYALVKDIVVAHALDPITMKGITREVVPYVVERPTEIAGEEETVVSEHTAGLDLRLDLANIDDADAERASAILRNAMAALEQRKSRADSEAG
jgi:class 3 adenylate cyclase